jgi:hypothetical protein
MVHAMPGRLRLRLPVPAQTSALVDVVRAASGVTKCAWNERTHSLLVHYRPEETTARAIIDTVANHTGVPAPADEDDAAAGEMTVAEVITSTVTHLNARIARSTGRRLDLGVLVSLALGAWAFRQFLRSQVPPPSWSSALWYAHGLFRDYAVRRRP